MSPLLSVAVDMPMGVDGRRRQLETAILASGLLVCLGLVPFAGSRPAPASARPALSPSAPVAASPAPAPVTRCRDDGRSGKRVLALYVHGDQQEDRFTTLERVFQTWLDEIDAAFVRAAEKHTGGFRQVRYVRDEQCRTVVEDVTIPQVSMKSVESVTTAIKALGYDRPDRKYIVWTDRKDCGVGFGAGGNDVAAWYNLYNFGPHYAAIGTDCWGWAPTLHELLHTLGAVSPSAPHATTNGHCWDDEDVLCYDDGGLPAGGLKRVCPAPRPDRGAFALNQIDCNGDDYFNTDPEPGTYLATHWNVADSDFLYTTPATTAPGSVPPASVPADSGASWPAETPLPQDDRRRQPGQAGPGKEFTPSGGERPPS